MGTIALSFERKAGEGGTLFGSVTTMDIAEALNGMGYEIDRRRISLKEPIKETGEYTVKVKLHREVALDVPVTVTPEGGEAAPEPRSEKKAKRSEAEEVPAAESAIEESSAAEAEAAE